MHYCGIIVKKKEVSVVEARKVFGEMLVEKGVADWYSTDDYRERKFEDDKVEITLEEFISKFKDDFKGLPICFIDEEGYVFEQIIPSEFYEYYDAKNEREALLETQAEAYEKQLNINFSKLKDIKDYNVCLIDYHN